MAGKSQKVALDERVRSSLEIDKVLALVQRETCTQMAAEGIGGLPVLSDPARITTLLAEVSETRRLLDDGETLPVETFADITALLKKLRLEGAVCGAPELVDLARIARLARTLRAFCETHREAYPLLWATARAMEPLPSFEKAIARAIDPESCDILDSASSELRRIRREIASTSQKIRKGLQRVLGQAAARDMLQENLIAMREGRLVLMVKDEHRRKITGIVHDQSASGQTVFIEPMESVELNNRVRKLEGQEKAEIQKILRELSGLAREASPALATNYETLLELDGRHAKAAFSQKFRCESPTVDDSGALVLYKAAHPLLREKLSVDHVVPLDLQLGESFTTLVVTGPNAGGKTVAMKTAGVSVLLARMGLPIPAGPDSKIGLLGRVFVDIGDQQSIENDLSTFTSHLERVCEMVDSAARHDFVLIDEIGSGTDPEEGVALAIAVLSHLQSREARSMVTTHHGALKAYAYETAGVENGSMIFDSETLQPTYRFQPGVPGSSYAFEIAARLGLESAVIEAARARAGEAQGKLEGLIQDLQRRLSDQTELVRELRLEESKLRGLSALYRDRAERLAANERELQKRALAESEEILDRANALVEETVRNIRESQASRESIRVAKERMEAERARLQKKRASLEKAAAANEKPAEPETDAALQEGDVVLWKPQRAEATILKLENGSNQVQIQVGSLRMQVARTDLAPVKKDKKRQQINVRAAESATVPQHVDVRGQRVEEALDAVDRYLSEAVLCGWDQVRIIHGKGTGALRAAIGEQLQRHPQVKSFKAAKLGQGDIGVTEVELA